MDIFKIAILAIIVVFVIAITKELRPEFAVLVSVAGSIVLLLYVLGYFGTLLQFYNRIVVATGVSHEYFAVILKCIGIGYLVEFASSICRDSGCASMSDKVVFAGKISVLALAVPIIQSLFDLISGML